MTNFLQSQEWMNFQGSLGHKVWSIAKGNIKGLVIKYSLPFNESYLYCPYGPVITHSSVTDSDDFNYFLAKIKKIAESENAIFFRVDPQINFDFNRFGFKQAPQNYHFSATAMPKEVAILDISTDEKNIFKNMKPKTRYNIRLAEKGEIITRQGNSLENLNIFYDLVCKTSLREKIKPHQKERYQKLLEVFGDKISVFTAFWQNKPVAGIMVLFFDKTATYLHGGLDANYKNLMAPHLLQWNAICEAKKRGCLEYDFGGVSLEKNHQWAGVTRFKLGFGAKAVTYPGAYDLIFQPMWYGIYNLVRKFRN